MFNFEFLNLAMNKNLTLLTYIGFILSLAFLTYTIFHLDLDNPSSITSFETLVSLAFFLIMVFMVKKTKKN